MSKKRNAIEGMGGLALLILALRMLFFGASGVQFENVTNFTELAPGGVLETLGPGEDGDILVVKFDISGMEIKNSENIHLEGNLDYDGIAGDVLVFRYEQGSWREFSRHLVEETF